MGYHTQKFQHVTISPGNTKLGAVPNVSLVPKLCCPSDAPCQSDCYARKAYNQYPNVKECWNRNSVSVVQNPTAYFADIEEYLFRETPEFFRWHVAGDIPDFANIPAQEYLRNMFRIARKFPGTKFVCFSKRHELNFKGRPKNLTIILSMWPAWGNTKKRMPRAWMQDGTETRVPDDALECPGNCESCAMCWHLNDIERDVVFEKH